MIFKAAARGESEYIFPKDITPKKFANCVFEGDKITVGPGFSFKEKPIFHTDDSSPYEMSFELTDCYVTYKNAYGRIGVSIAENFMGYIAYNMIFISEDGCATSLGSLEFSRNSDEFARPDAFTFFSGSKKAGDGIYMIYRQAYENETFVGIREYSSKDGGWLMLSESHFYAPTLLEYGRGESFHFAEINGNPLRFPNPTNPEPKNMISSKFISKFTTDGASFGFSLPLMNLDASAVSAKLTLSGEGYEFRISPDLIKSDAVSVLGEEVIMYCDRGFGRVYFKKKSGGEWIPPFSGEYNNLSVTAYKTTSEHKERIAAMTSAKKLPGSAVTGGEAVTLFWGSKLSSSSIILNSPTDPLYFPLGSEYTLGEEREISEVVSVSKYLYIFKGSEVYRSEIKAVKERASYPLTFSLVTELPSAPAKNNVCELGDKVLFADELGNIYSLKLGGSYLCKKLMAGGGGFDFCLGTEDKLLLIKEKTALLLQKKGDEFIFGQWSLPKRCVGALYSPREALFLFENMSGGQYDILAASLVSNGADTNAELEFELKPNADKVRLLAITLFGEGGAFWLTLSGDGKPALKRRGSLKGGRERLLIGEVSDNMSVTLCFEEGFSLEKIKTEYNTKGVI